MIGPSTVQVVGIQISNWYHDWTIYKWTIVTRCTLLIIVDLANHAEQSSDSFPWIGKFYFPFGNGEETSCFEASWETLPWLGKQFSFLPEEWIPNHAVVGSNYRQRSKQSCLNSSALLFFTCTLVKSSHAWIVLLCSSLLIRWSRVADITWCSISCCMLTQDLNVFSVIETFYCHL